VDMFARTVICRHNTKAKLNKHPNFLCGESLLDDYSLHVGGEYHLSQTHYCTLTGTPFGNLTLELASIKERPGEVYLRDCFSF
jgi:hypothetical protein